MTGLFVLTTGSNWPKPALATDEYSTEKLTFGAAP